MTGRAKRIDKREMSKATAASLEAIELASGAIELASGAKDMPVSPAKATPALPSDLENLRTAILTDTTAVVTSLLNSALTPVNRTLEAIKSTLDIHGQRISSVESGLSDYSDRVVEMEGAYAQLKTENARLADKLDDLENRSRRANLRVIGIPEKMEGSDPIQFMTELFSEICGANLFPTPLIPSRAHRLGKENKAGGNKPRPRAFIVLFHNYQDKERVFGKRREDLRYHGHKISLYPDFSVELSRKRAAYNDVKARLYKKDIRFGMLYPARLRVDFEDQTLYFDSPAAAQTFYNAHWHD